MDTTTIDTVEQTNKMSITSGNSSVLDCALGQQVQISEQVYRETSERLIEAIGDKNYFSGSLVFEVEDVECRLTISVIVYRSDAAELGGESNKICRLVPVWWEFHTRVGMQEIPNDFRFEELQKNS